MINYIKGADLAIIPRLSKSSDQAKNQETIKLMDEYATTGLRVLMFGQKILPAETTKESLKDEPLENFEGDIELLGITGLEDLLQDNVAECIK